MLPSCLHHLYALFYLLRIVILPAYDVLGLGHSIFNLDMEAGHLTQFGTKGRLDGCRPKIRSRCTDSKRLRPSQAV